MAYIENKYCYFCEKFSSHLDGVCPICRERGNRERIAAWNTLTVDEKLQDLRRRVEALERPEPTY
jgi:hypothetical protein